MKLKAVGGLNKGIFPGQGIIFGGFIESFLGEKNHGGDEGVHWVLLRHPEWTQSEYIPRRISEILRRYAPQNDAKKC